MSPMKSSKVFAYCFAVAVLPVLCFPVNATVIHAAFETEIVRTALADPFDAFPNGAVITWKTIASGSFSYDTNGIGDLERFMGSQPGIHLENSLFFNDEDWTQFYQSVEGLPATDTEWSIDPGASQAVLNPDGSFSFNLVARRSTPGNRIFNAAGAGGPPPTLENIFIGSETSNWDFLYQTPSQKVAPVVSSYTISAVPEPGTLVLLAFGWLAVLVVRKGRGHGAVLNDEGRHEGSTAVLNGSFIADAKTSHAFGIAAACGDALRASRCGAG